MQSRYLLAIYAFALVVAIVSAQQAGQQNESPLLKLREQAEKAIRESIHGAEAAVHCIREAGEHCKGESFVNYIKCAVQYLKDNRERCKKEQQ